MLVRRVGVVAWIVDGIRFISLYSWVGGRLDRRLQLPPVLCGHPCRVGCHSPSAQPDAPPGRLCVARHQAAWRVNGLPGMAPSPPRRHKRVVPRSTIRSSCLVARRSSCCVGVGLVRAREPRLLRRRSCCCSCVAVGRARRRARARLLVDGLVAVASFHLLRRRRRRR